MLERVEIVVKGGCGGKGVVGFRKEKFVPRGGPDGGNGGAGGDVFIVAESKVSSLNQYRQRQRFQAKTGGQGGKQKRHGRKGEALILSVPVGTIVFSKDMIGQEVLVADLNRDGQRVLVANGGRGGLGNAHFVTPTNQAPQIATEGEAGEERWIILDLKLIVDATIIGYPNVGKSMLLASISQAHPKVADYPFTTREPVLGVVEVGRQRFDLVELPGLIEDAHSGKGLGYDFLRHAERSKVLIHLLDGNSPTLIDEINKLNAELALYKPSLAQKPQVVVVNKIDLPQVQNRLSEIKQALSFLDSPLFFISAVTKQGVPELLVKVAEMVKQAGAEPTELEMPVAVFRPKPKVKRG